MGAGGQGWIVVQKLGIFFGYLEIFFQIILILNQETFTQI
jgi:hypothetical protein